MSNREIAKLIWELEDTACWIDKQSERIAVDGEKAVVRSTMKFQFAGRAALIRQIISQFKQEAGTSADDVMREVQAIDGVVPQFGTRHRM